MQQSVAAPGNEGQKQRPLHLRASGYLVEQASNLLRALSSLVFGNRGGPAEPGVRIAGAPMEAARQPQQQQEGAVQAQGDGSRHEEATRGGAGGELVGPGAEAAAPVGHGEHIGTGSKLANMAHSLMDKVAQDAEALGATARQEIDDFREHAHHGDEVAVHKGAAVMS